MKGHERTFMISQYIHVSKLGKLYTLNTCSLSYINHLSIKLLKDVKQVNKEALGLFGRGALCLLLNHDLRQKELLHCCGERILTTMRSQGGCRAKGPGFMGMSWRLHTRQ